MKKIPQNNDDIDDFIVWHGKLRPGGFEIFVTQEMVDDWMIGELAIKTMAEMMEDESK